MVKCLFVVYSCCIHKGFLVSPQVKIQKIQIRWAWRPCSGSSSPSPSVMIGVIENISHSTAKMSGNWIGYDSIHSGITQNKCFRTEVDMDNFSCFVCGTRARSFSPPFSYTLYSIDTNGVVKYTTKA
jgi:hypothetical protein